MEFIEKIKMLLMTPTGRLLYAAAINHADDMPQGLKHHIEEWLSGDYHNMCDCIFLQKRMDIYYRDQRLSRMRTQIMESMSLGWSHVSADEAEYENRMSIKTQQKAAQGITQTMAKNQRELAQQAAKIEWANQMKGLGHQNEYERTLGGIPEEKMYNAGIPGSLVRDTISKWDKA